MNNLSFWAIVFLSFLVFRIDAQTFEETDIEAVTSNGKTVILKQDGTWKYKPIKDGKEVQTYNDGFATVFFYRVKEIKGLASNQSVPVTINNQIVFKMPQSRFIGIKLKPGRYEVIMKKREAETLLEVESGKTYFVKVSQTGSGFYWVNNINVVPENEALFQMRELYILEESKIKDTSQLFVKDRPKLKSLE